MKMKVMLGLLAAGVLAMTSQAGDMVPVAKGRTGVELDGTFSHLKADIGGEDFKDTPFGAQASVFYGLTDKVDLRATARYTDAKDSDADVSMKLLRLGLGSRYWFSGDGRLFPFAGGALNYYNFSTDGGDNEKGMVGLSAEGGVAYMVYEWLALQAGLQGEFSFVNGSVETRGKEHDVKIYGIGMTLGASVLF